jgi:small subunit ribosomal protein S21
MTTTDTIIHGFSARDDAVSIFRPGVIWAGLVGWEFLSKPRGNMQVVVRDNNVDQALRVLKKKMQREGIFREMKQRRAYEKPSEKRVRERAEAIRRVKKQARKKAQREGLLPIPKPKPRPGTGSPRSRNF